MNRSYRTLLLSLSLLLAVPACAQNIPQRAALLQEATPMEAAVLKNQPRELSRLLAAGANPAELGIDGQTVLYAAAGAERDEYLRILLRAGVSPNLKARDGQSALVNALHAEKHDHMRLLLDAGANPNQADIVGNTPLHVAAKIMDYRAVLLLLERGANPALKNRNGHTFQAYLYPDENVPLNQRGRERLQKVTDWLQARGIPPERPGR
ncbi:MAG: ankyrin repeat domain-containing protein [Eikenella sp.]|nr:ankyrin repeat domain-containing protein [Eikenella sp.]